MMVLVDEERQLQSWSFLKDYEGHSKELVELAKVVYSVACYLCGAPPQQADCLPLYSRALYRSQLYQEKIVRRKLHMPEIVYETFASKLALYVLAKNWETIRSVPCP